MSSCIYFILESREQLPLSKPSIDPTRLVFQTHQVALSTHAVSLAFTNAFGTVTKVGSTPFE